MALLKGGCEEEPEKVLQTRTVPLQEVRRDLESWKEAMTDEYNALVNGTKVVKPVDEKDLDGIPGIENAEFAPGKLVTTIKAPLGRKRARAVSLLGWSPDRTWLLEQANAPKPERCPLAS